jgi:hypothetical protein
MTTQPTIAARQVANEYFQSRGIERPESQANRFLRRITFYSRTGQWRSDTLIETALGIIKAQAFDVDDLAENHLHIALNIESLRDYDKIAGSPVFGVAFASAKEIVICERAEGYLPLYRTCVVHEIAHVLLHGGADKTSGMNYSPGALKRPLEEREADEFMIAFLAPPSVIKIAVGLAAHRSSIDINEVWHRANSTRGRFQWKTDILPRLIDMLCLSRLLLAIQMVKLGVFSAETAEYHKSYALPTRWRQ